MKATSFNKAIIYDDNCPLCQAYTKAFVSTGFLDKENRIPFSSVCKNLLPGNEQKIKIDWQRARHEIPLVDKENGNVFYGIDALAEVLQQKIFFIKPVLNFPPVRWFFLKLYKFISYNRKVIVANHSPVVGEINSSPDFSMRWRIVFIAFLLFVSGTLFISSGIVDMKAANGVLISLIISSPIVFLFLITGSSTKKMMIEILAQCSIVCFIALFFTNAIIFFKNFFSLPLFFIYLFCGAGVVMLCKQVSRRVNFLLNELNA